MARPQKLRRVCSMPCRRRFGPLGERPASDDVVTISLDEYEAVRLIDLEGMTQEECADAMHVARTTVQGIYLAARKKLADILVNGKTLLIEGGSVQLCDGGNAACPKGACCKQRFDGNAD